MNDSSSLRSLQAAFVEAIVDADHEPESAWVREHGLRARQRLNVYYHHNQIVQLGALQGIFPAIQRLVGDDFFAQLARLYGEHSPLHCGDLRTFGAQLPAFMESFEPLVSLPYLPDVARLEWACHESLHSGEIQPPSLQQPPDPANGLRLAAHVRLLHSAYPVAQIWEFALSDHGVDSPRLNIDDAGPNHFLVMRPGLDVEVYALPRDEWAWLTAYASGWKGSGATAGEDEQSRQQKWWRNGVLVADAVFKDR